MQSVLLQILICLSALYSLPVFAHCNRTDYLKAGDAEATKIDFGTVNLSSSYLQPVGTLLSSVVVPSTTYTYKGAVASTVLWECDVADLPNIQFLVATNGDDRVGGFYDLGVNDGIPDTYATYFRYIAIKQMMSGATISRYWQAIPIQNYEIVGNKLHIRLQDIPPLYAELYRVSQVAPRGGRTHYCGNSTTQGQIDSGTYTCMQPSAYIQLQGPGMTSDQAGQDSAYNYRFWNADNGFAYTMWGNNTLVSQHTCVARSVTPFVLFDTMNASALNEGQSVQSNFNVSIECSNLVDSGTNASQTAIGLQVSNRAYKLAQRFGLVNASLGVPVLLSGRYDDANMAKAVGIYLSNANTGQDMNFIGQSNVHAGALSGWYPVLLGAQASGSAETGYISYIHTFTATLKKVPGLGTVTPGKVQATAYVLVRVQ